MCACAFRLGESLPRPCDRDHNDVTQNSLRGDVLKIPRLTVLTRVRVASMLGHALPKGVTWCQAHILADTDSDSHVRRRARVRVSSDPVSSPCVHTTLYWDSWARAKNKPRP